MIIPFKSVSISHRTAPLTIREMVALNEEESKAFAIKCKDLFGLSELLIVSTCNRTELYYTTPVNISEDLVKALLIEKGIQVNPEFLNYFKHRNETEDSLRYLFEVATGLQSKVVGDLQIPNQIKKAYQLAADLNLAGPYLHRLMHTIFYSNKRVAQETSFRDGAASVSYATVALAEELSQAILQPKVLILGLGETREEVTQALVDLHDAGCDLITITQYLRPTNRHHPVERWVKPEEFVELSKEATDIGFLGVMSGPLVRSSYRAGRLYKQAIDAKAARG